LFTGTWQQGKFMVFMTYFFLNKKPAKDVLSCEALTYFDNKIDICVDF
jgi:hypothetical protein